MRITKDMKLKIAPKNSVFLALLILLIFFPAISSDYYILLILIFANIGAVYAASWDLTAGVTGQFSFGQILFFGIAGYVSGALNLFLGLPPLLTIPIGGAFGVLVGLIVGLPSLRLKGPYFRIVSLTFPGILSGIILMYPEVTGGEAGFYGLSPISSDIVTTYYASVLLMLVSIFILLRIVSSRIGLVFRSIRENEDVAEAIGINTTRYKLLAWAISGFFAGIAGGFQTHQLMTISPFVFGTVYSFQAILYALLGGIGTIIGSVGGSYLLTILNELLRCIADLRAMMYAVVMIIVYLFIPMGIYRWLAIRFNIQLGTWDGLKKLRRKKLNAPNP
ncbi:MAG: branched-chain amino acid ABC transporter permease [Candidatus Bathyarchaeum sp.]|nr:MAG: branched-chain amino acid ABC transporter permease [Candidatus Bathyarchaeum sp.]